MQAFSAASIPLVGLTAWQVLIAGFTPAGGDQLGQEATPFGGSGF
jgi:NADPH:quinone reductase-like Zn-dependent oxidoreductase